MKRLLLILILVFAFNADARMSGVMLSGAGTAAAGANECDGKLICENAEGTGTPNGWSDAPTATVDWDYTTSPAPLRGSQSVAIPPSARSAYGSLSGGGDVWAFMRFQTADGQPSATNYIMRILNADDDANIGILQINTNGAIRHYNGTGQQSSAAGTLSDGASGVYCVWWHLKRGAGELNGESHVWFDLCSNVCSGATCTRPASESITAITAGTWSASGTDAITDDVGLFRIWAVGTDNLNIYDQIYLDDAEIGTVGN